MPDFYAADCLRQLPLPEHGARGAGEGGEGERGQPARHRREVHLQLIM